MKVTPLRIPDVCLLEPPVYGDERGFLVVPWSDDVFRREIADVAFVQDNHSRSRRWTLRGLHYQESHTQGKLIRCTAGLVWDVVVDMRRSSPTFGQWVAAELSADAHTQLWVPAGFAHGFVVLSESADLQYKVTDRYDPTSERTLRWDDPDVGIAWPLPVGTSPVLSPKDMKGSALAALAGLP